MRWTIVMVVILVAAVVSVVTVLTGTPAAASDKNPVVVMETSMGTIKIQLDAEKAPVTVKNFLDYVDAKHYDGTIFHRVIGDFMIQGGGFGTDKKEKETRPEIKNESDNGLHNARGTIAMARRQDPNSASAQFYINVVDNSEKLDPMGGRAGYAVFGKVIDGMDVVDKIKAVKTHDAELTINGRAIPSENVPVEDVVIKSVRRADK